MDPRAALPSVDPSHEGAATVLVEFAMSGSGMRAEAAGSAGLADL